MDVDQLENFTVSFYDVKDQFKRHVYKRSLEAFDEGDQARDAIVNKTQLQNRQSIMRDKFLQAIGGLPSNNAPLDAGVTDTIQRQSYRIEKVIFSSRLGIYVTANLYVPDGVERPRGAVLFLCGHSEQAKQHPQYQMVCQHLVKVGLVVLAMDPIGQGERLSFYEPTLGEPTVRSGTGEHDYVGSQCLPLGHSLARYFVHDAMRAIDYLCTRPEVDPSKIGVTGNSGGGTQTSMMMVCDSRIAAAAPATFIMNRRTYLHAGGAQDNEQIWPGMSALGFDHEDILLAMTPRPVRVLAVQYDFFPIEGTRTTVERSKRFWEIFGAGDCLDLIEDASVHSYTEPLAKAAAEFFARHLLRKEVLVPDWKIETLPPSELWCTQSGQVRSDHGDAKSVHEENVDHLTDLEQRRKAIPPEKRKQQAMTWLREKVMFTRQPCDFNPRHIPLGHMEDLLVQSSLWWSHKDIFNHAFVFRYYEYQDHELPMTIAVWDDGTTQIRRHIDWIRNTCKSGRAVMVLDVSGAGVLLPPPLNNRNSFGFYGVIHKLADDLIWLGDSLPALRTYDVLRAIELASTMPQINGKDIRLYAHGRYGMYARLAAILQGDIAGIDVADSTTVSEWIKARHYDSHDIMSVVFPEMLKYFDLNDL